MLIFCNQITDRIIYTLDFIFGIRGISYQLTNDPILFNKSTGDKLNYSIMEFTNCSVIEPCELLFTDSVKSFTIEASYFKDIHCLQFNGVCDPIASIFYILSRFEEYNNPKRDKHGRFLAAYSILKQYDWHTIPICDSWSIQLIKSFFPNSIIIKPKFTILPTFDIDSTYAYLRKNNLRNAFSYWRDRILGKKELAQERKNVREGNLKDPFDTYDFIIDKTKGFSNVHFFWLLGSYAQFDRNISAEDPIQKTIIQKLNANATIGIHPSYASNERPFLLNQEIKNLSDIIQKPILSSRQHYLKLSLPITYRNLLKEGIQKDFTMGFADEAGFRMGTANPYPWFDLEKNEITKLILYPFMYMDGTLNQYMKLSPKQSIALLTCLKNEVQCYGGNFSFIWHNETLGSREIWKDWLPVFEASLAP